MKAPVDLSSPTVRWAAVLLAVVSAPAELVSQSVGPAWDVGGGGQHRFGPKSEFTGFGFMSLGLRLKYFSIGVDGWVVSKEFFDSVAITPQNVPTLDRLLRADGRWGLTFSTEMDFVISRDGLEISALSPEPEEPDKIVHALLVRLEGDGYTVPDSSANNEYQARSVSDGRLFVGYFHSRRLTALRLMVGLGQNQRLDRPFDGLQEKNVLDVFEFNFDDLRFFARVDVRTPRIKDLANVETPFWAKLLSVRPFARIDLDVPLKARRDVVLSDGSRRAAERIGEYVVQFGFAMNLAY